MKTVKIWDLPTRVFHWCLAIAVLAAIASSKVGGDAMSLHMQFGYATLGLVVFRVVWGLFGGYWSRFSNWPLGATAMRRYLRGEAKPSETAGHSPTGALASLALLTVVLAQAVSGLVADDEIASFGPLVPWVSSSVSGWATWYHHEVGQLLLLGLIGMHLLAIAFYTLIKRQSLIQAMLGGFKSLAHEVPDSQDAFAARLKGLLLLAFCVGGAWLLLSSL